VILIYGLLSPDGELRYVGMTKRGAVSRLKDHRNAGRRFAEGRSAYHTPVIAWCAWKADTP
jgi:hypothetical protein